MKSSAHGSKSKGEEDSIQKASIPDKSTYSNHSLKKEASSYHHKLRHGHPIDGKIQKMDYLLWWFVAKKLMIL